MQKQNLIAFKEVAYTGLHTFEEVDHTGLHKTPIPPRIRPVVKAEESMLKDCVSSGNECRRASLCCLKDETT